MIQTNHTGRPVRAAYTLVRAKDKSRKPGDTIPCACGREGCAFVFDPTQTRQMYRNEGCRQHAKNIRQRASYAAKIARRG